MRIYLVACLVTVTLNVATCAPNESRNPEEFTDQEGCYLEDHKRMVPLNQSYSPENGETCIQYECQSDGTLSTLRCDDNVAIPEGCTKFSNLTLPYPACCARALC